MSDPNPLVRRVQLEAITILEDQRALPLSVSIPELYRHEPATFELNASHFMTFLTGNGNYREPTKRLEKWCQQNGLKTSCDPMVMVISVV